MSVRDDLIAAKKHLLDGANSVQEACHMATGDITGGAAYRAVLAAITEDRLIGWIPRALDRAIAAAGDPS